MYPTTVSRKEIILGSAVDLGKIEVNKELKITKLETFNDYLRKGDLKDILNYMRTNKKSGKWQNILISSNLLVAQG
jgi:hypothetical protein